MHVIIGTRINPDRDDMFVVAQVGGTRIGLRARVRNLAGRFVAVRDLVEAIVTPIRKAIPACPLARTIVLLAAFVVGVRRSPGVVARIATGILRVLARTAVKAVRAFTLNDVTFRGRVIVPARAMWEAW